MLPAATSAWGAAGIGAVTGGLTAGAGQITENLLNGCPWDHNLAAAVVSGAFIGGVVGAAGYGVRQAFNRFAAWWKHQRNLRLVKEIGRRAFEWGRKMGFRPTSWNGTKLHKYAERMLDIYQILYGNRGLTPEARYINGQPWVAGMGSRGSVILDVVEGNLRNPKAVYDYKFWNARLTPQRIAQIINVGGFASDIPIIEIHFP